MSSQDVYIQMCSIHGLLRAEAMELGRDADTGGQIKYVVELARALGRRDDIGRVDLLTRRIVDKTVSEDYAREEEGLDGVSRIVRIQCGGRKYMRKELLWPHLDEYVDKTIRYIKRQGRIPDLFHGHYPDAGYVAATLGEVFGVPVIYTGHSMGRSKRKRLEQQGMSEREMNRRYKIDHRIRMEEEVMKSADLVVASTRQEKTEQYGQYDNHTLPPYEVIPPGLDIEKFYPYYHDTLPGAEKSEIQLQARASVLEELNRFFTHPDKPLILSLCRPDKRKNIAGLIQGFGEDSELQAMANLAIFAGIRKDITGMEDNEREVLTEILLLMDKYDLYGKIAVPKKHDFAHEVPEMYRVGADKRGVFVNPALTEPFGITLIESAACGLPVIAPEDGGPKDIIHNCRNGMLVDTTKPKEIAAAAKQMISDGETWKRYSQSGIDGVRKHYTWSSHADKYRKALDGVMENFTSSRMGVAVPTDAIGRRLAKTRAFLVTDIDNTLIGDSNHRLEALTRFLREHRDHLAFGVATGRGIESAVERLEPFGLPVPDIFVAATGSEIYYGRDCRYGRGWETHIKMGWHREKIVESLKSLPFLTERPPESQGRYKISYTMTPKKDRLADIHRRLLHEGCRCNLIYSKSRYLDILPHRASKGKALRYLSTHIHKYNDV